MENKETEKRVVTNEELMQKLEALEKRIDEIHDAVFLQLNTMQMYNMFLDEFFVTKKPGEVLHENIEEFKKAIKLSNMALMSMLMIKQKEFDKRKKESYRDKYSVADELLRTIFG